MTRSIEFARRSAIRCRITIPLVGLLCAAAQAPVSDHPEPGLQGQSSPADVSAGVLARPYSKSVRLIGHTSISDRAGNVTMAWIGQCAYVSSASVAVAPGMKPASREKSGVAVIDVRKASAPKLVRLLRDKGSVDSVETIHAVSAAGRKILVAGAYGGGKPGAPPDDSAWLDIYDASECTNPKLVAEYKWPENVHMVTLAPNGRRVYGTAIDPFTGKGGLLVLDITDPRQPRFAGRFGITRPDGTSYEFAAHEVSISPDERRIYAGVISSRGEDLNLDVGDPAMSAARLGNNAGGIYIIDNSDIVDGRPDPKLRLIGTALHGGWHSPVQASVNGTPYLVSAGELGACPGAWPKIVNIADETKPAIAGEFKLQMNLPENCPPRTKIENDTRGIVGSPGTAASHFNDVDSATGTRLGLFPFMWAGLRIVDLRDTAHPVEVAYFKPGDPCMSQARYVRERGHIWFACNESGFYVIELAPELRSVIGLPRVSGTRHAARNSVDGSAYD